MRGESPSIRGALLAAAVALAASLPGSAARAQSPPPSEATSPDPAAPAPAPPPRTPAAGAPAPVATPSGTPEPAAPATDAERVAALVANGKSGAAALACDELEAAATAAARPLDMPARQACAKAHLGLGDRFDALDALDDARAHWRPAARLDPRLLDDPDFLARIARYSSARPPPPTTRKRPARTVVPVGRRLPGGGAVIRRAPAPGPAQPSPDTRPPGPRTGRKAGVGLSGGYDGLAALTLSWMHRELVEVGVSVGVVYPIIDTRIRLFGFRRALTPSIGFGMATPLRSGDRFGLDLERYEALYDLGEFVHVDVGLSWAPLETLDVYGGIGFVSTLDTEHPDHVVFFPQPQLQVTWYP